jgi:hypothetical protein
LYSYGWLTRSFRPQSDIIVFAALAQEAGTCIRCMQKALTERNVPLANGISDISGATGMRILRAILEGKPDPRQLAQAFQAIPCVCYRWR